MDNDNAKEARKIGVFTGFLFLGMAAGYYYKNYLIGMFTGMGIGFLVMAILMTTYKK